MASDRRVFKDLEGAPGWEYRVGINYAKWHDQQEGNIEALAPICYFHYRPQDEGYTVKTNYDVASVLIINGVPYAGIGVALKFQNYERSVGTAKVGGEPYTSVEHYDGFRVVDNGLGAEERFEKVPFSASGYDAFTPGALKTIREKAETALAAEVESGRFHEAVADAYRVKAEYLEEKVAYEVEAHAKSITKLKVEIDEALEAAIAEDHKAPASV